MTIHAFGYLGLRTDGALHWVWEIVSATGVSAFFLADGWLHAFRHRAPIPAPVAIGILVTSFQRLVVPWAVYSSVYLTIGILVQQVASQPARPLIPDGIVDVPHALWRGIAATQLYFLPALFLVRVASIFLYPFVRGKPLLSAIVAGTGIGLWKFWIEPIVPHPIEGNEPLLAACFGLSFAALGWSLAEAELSNVPAIYWGVAAVSLIMFAIPLVERVSGALAQTAFLFVGWYVARSFADYRLHGWLVVLGRHTMEIYLLHMPIVISGVSRLVLLIGLPDLWLLILDVLATVVISLSVAHLMRWVLPVWSAKPLGVAVNR